MSTNEETLKQNPPHPMPGWVCVMPVPMGKSSAKIHNMSKGEDHEIGDIDGLPDFIRSLMGEKMENEGSDFAEGLFAVEPGISAAILIDPGSLEPNWEHFDEMKAGQTKVFYPEGRGLTINDYVFVQWTSIIAWDNN